MISLQITSRLFIIYFVLGLLTSCTTMSPEPCIKSECVHKRVDTSNVKYHFYETLVKEDINEQLNGYAMYTYVLMGCSCDDDSKEGKNLQLLLENITTRPEIQPASRVSAKKKDESNLFLIPSRVKKITTSFTYTHFDFDYSKALIQDVQGLIKKNDAVALEAKHNLKKHNGPFLVSVLHPINNTSSQNTAILYVDMSDYPITIVKQVLTEHMTKIESNVSGFEKLNSIRLKLLEGLVKVENSPVWGESIIILQMVGLIEPANAGEQ